MCIIYLTLKVQTSKHTQELVTDPSVNDALDADGSVMQWLYGSDDEQSHNNSDSEYGTENTNGHSCDHGSNLNCDCQLPNYNDTTLPLSILQQSEQSPRVFTNCSSPNKLNTTNFQTV